MSDARVSGALAIARAYELAALSGTLTRHAAEPTSYCGMPDDGERLRTRCACGWKSAPFDVLDRAARAHAEGERDAHVYSEREIPYPTWAYAYVVMFAGRALAGRALSGGEPPDSAAGVAGERERRWAVTDVRLSMPRWRAPLCARRFHSRGAIMS